MVMKRLLMGLWVMVACCTAHAQGWPQGPIRLIVPYALAGATDAQARMLAAALTRDTGWALEVENRSGAGGSVGLELLAKSRPDGQTLAIGQTSNLVIHQAMGLPRPFDVQKAFVPIALLAQQPLLLVVRLDSPHTSLADLLKEAKGGKSPLTMVSAANGSVGHMAGAILMKRAGVRLTHIPYTGAAPALTALMSGHADFAMPTAQAALPSVKAGRLRILATTSLHRLPLLPNVPTVAESGFPGLVVQEWKMLMGPSGMPADRLNRLHLQVLKVQAKTDWSAQLAQDGGQQSLMPQTDLPRFLEGERLRWRSLVREIHPGSS